MIHWRRQSSPIVNIFNKMLVYKHFLPLIMGFIRHSINYIGAAILHRNHFWFILLPAVCDFLRSRGPNSKELHPNSCSILGDSKPSLFFLSQESLDQGFLQNLELRSMLWLTDVSVVLWLYSSGSLLIDRLTFTHTYFQTLLNASQEFQLCCLCSSYVSLFQCPDFIAI